MTDKQIIIDGCDVSKCEHFEDEECLNPSETVANCEASPNCCYKQLKRAEQRIVELNKMVKAKEQECEELKIYIESNEQQVKEVETLVMDNDRLINELDQLKAENDDLKKYKDVVDKLAGMQVILTNEEKMPMLYENAKDLKLKQLSKTLIEIKEIAEKAEEQCAIPENYFKRNNVSWKQHQLNGLTCKFKQILQKISEVENG